MTRLEEIRELYRFNAWAQERMFAVTETLSADEISHDLNSSFASIRETLIHAVGAEWVWLTRWQGTSPTVFPNADDLKTNDDILTRWRGINAERDSFLNSLDEKSLDDVVEYTSFAGKHFAFPCWQMLRHVVNHATYHRGQIMTMLRQLGHNAKSTDMILMYQEESPAPSA